MPLLYYVSLILFLSYKLIREGGITNEEGRGKKEK